MKQQSMKSSRRGNSLEGSKFILLQAVGEIQSIDPQPEVSAFGARARSSPSSVDRRSLSFSSISSTLQSSRRHLGFSLAREPLLFFGIRGVDCIRSSVSWPEYGGECEECQSLFWIKNEPFWRFPNVLNRFVLSALASSVAQAWTLLFFLFFREADLHRSREG